MRAQLGEYRFLPGGEARCQRGGAAGGADQQFERMIALVQLQFGVEYCNGCGDMDKDFPEARFAITQRSLGVAHSQQCAQRRQQHVGIDRVNQIGIAASIQAGDDVVGFDRGGRNVN